MKKLTYFSFLFFWFSACEQESIATLNQKTAVIDGYLYAGQPVDSVQITQSFSYSSADTLLITLDDLEVTLFDGETDHLLESVGNGFYTNHEMLIQPDKRYSIQFNFNGKQVSAETFVPEVRKAVISETEVSIQKIEGFPSPGSAFFDLEPVEITWDNPEGDYYFVVVKNIEEDPEYVNSIFENGDFPFRRFVQLTRPQITDFHAIDLRRDIRNFGTHMIIVFRVNPEYAALYELSGASSTSITQPPSNVVNGLGILTGVSSDTLYLEVKKS